MNADKKMTSIVPEYKSAILYLRLFAIKSVRVSLSLQHCDIGVYSGILDTCLAAEHVGRRHGNLELAMFGSQPAIF